MKKNYYKASWQGSNLDALELVIADDQGGQPGQVAEHVRWQDRDLVVAQVPGFKQELYKD